MGFEKQIDTSHLSLYSTFKFVLITASGSVYELDGLKTGPIVIGKIGGATKSWLDVVKVSNLQFSFSLHTIS